MAEKYIKIRGARQHNLKDINLTIPRDKLVVFTGLSGSGKSSLAFDTIYAEGQRRYVESLSTYARQFLGQMEKPDVDEIEGLSPAISIDQKTTSNNPRSTVGTVTEIYDYLRLLWASIGVPHCPICGKEIKKQTVDQISDAVMSLDNGEKIVIMAPVVRMKKGAHQKTFEDARKNGFVRVRVDGIQSELSEEFELDKNKKHSIEIVVDRLVVKEEMRKRLTDSLETALKMSGGLVVIEIVGRGETLYSQNYACEECGVSIEELTPRMLSFNNPYGACPTCGGLGTLLEVDPSLLVANMELSIRQGGFKNCGGWSFSEKDSIASMYIEGLSKKYGFSLDVPLKDLHQSVIDLILYGSNGEKVKCERVSPNGGGTYYLPFEGLVNNLERRYKETKSDYARGEIESFMSSVNCPDCGGDRLKKESLAVTVGDINIADFTKLSVRKCLDFLDKLSLSEKDKAISGRIIKEAKERLGFLSDVGLDYLTLSRASGTLSGGESQRIRLSTQIGSYLTGVLYILDEPSIGLHQRDNERLIGTLKKLRDLDNTVIVVEHDEDTMYAADYIVDIGPGAGVHGGEVVCAGTIDDIKACENSITGQYLKGDKEIPVPKKRREGNGKTLKISGASENNLKNIDVEIPLGVLTCVTGVSGSGKSSLVNAIIYKRLARDLNRAMTRPGAHSGMEGIEYLDKVIDIDQSPIGRTPRSNPATYTGVFTDIRELFARVPDAKARGYNSGRFSFNVKGGRCEACCGDGIIKIEMHFLPDVYVTCDVCKGKRYNRETLEVRYKGRSISDVLNMTVEEALSFFENIPKIKRKLQTISDVGLGYIRLGQPATTLSGGEAQRVKLSTELSKRATGRTIYILDEPSTGLHIADVHKLIDVLDILVESGNTVIVIEHNLEIIKTADYIIDLGPEGGERGGEVVCAGTPERIFECKKSYTGKYLKKHLK